MTWVDLTLKELNVLYEHYHDQYGLPKKGAPDGFDYERAIIAKVKEKNETNCTGHRDEHGSRYDPFVRNSGH